MEYYLKDLHPENQLLIRLMQKYAYGAIENLTVKKGIACLHGKPKILWKVPFDFRKTERKEFDPHDFKLKKSHIQLMQTFKAFEETEVCIRKIEFHDGLPKIGSIELEPEYFLKNIR